jgi:feruloyl-CoA synthase
LLGDESLSAAQVAHAPQVIEAVRAAVLKHNETQRTSSMRVERVLLLEEPASAEADEITEKGYVNQRAVLKRRRSQVEQLYTEPVPAGVIVVDTSGHAT